MSGLSPAQAFGVIGVPVACLGLGLWLALILNRRAEQRRIRGDRA